MFWLGRIAILIREQVKRILITSTLRTLAKPRNIYPYEP